jgi:hypothetical protein
VEQNPAHRKRSTPARHDRRWWLLAAGKLIAAVALLGAISYLAVPPLVKRLLVGSLADALRRPVAVREVRFNPVQLSLTVAGLTIGEREGGAEFLSFDELFADLEAVSIFHRAPVLREIRLRGPRVHLVRREDGRTYNFSDLFGNAGKAGSETAPAQKDAPARFALHNIRVSGGRIVFEDRPRSARHEVADLELTIPFVSNFPARVDTFEQPALSALVNGAPFRLSGQTKPFKETLETVVDVDLQKIDVPRYLAYLPDDLGFTVREATLGTKLSVSFATPAEGRALIVRGSARLDRIALAERSGAPLLSLASLEVPAFTVDVFGRRLDVQRVTLGAPEATLVRRDGGVLNWSAAFLPAGPKPDAEPMEWKVAVGEVRVAEGVVHWRDEAVPGGFSAELEGVEAGLRSFAFPQQEPALVDLKLRTGFGESLAHRGSLRISPLSWEGDIEFSGVHPRAWEAYYRRSLAYEIRDGVLGASARVRFAAADGGLGFGFTGLAARLEGLKVRRRGERADFLTLASLELSGADLDLSARRLGLGSVALRKGSLALVRSTEGGVSPGVPPASPPVPDAQAPAPPPVAVATAPSTAPPSAASGPSWHVEAASVRLDDCAARLVDTTLAEWLTHTVAPLSAEATGLSTKPGSRAAFRLAAGINGEGRLTAKGDVGIAPFGARVDLDLKGLSLVPWYPYYADRVNFVTGSGALAAKGALVVAPGAGGTTAVSFSGDAAVTNFVSVDRLNAEEMLNWKSLSLGGVALGVAPFSLAIAEVVLSEFYSRLIIFPDGRLNVQRVVAGETGETGAVAPDAPPPAPAPTAAGAAATVTIARTTLQGGTVSFSDRFIKPNYSAVLTDLAGSVSGLSSQPGTTAGLEIRGRLDRSAPLSISGTINPLAGNLFLDVKAVVRDIELGALSPYSGRHLGYGIEKGKMSFDVSYRVENRKLSAENRLTLDQFSFGERVESPQATTLPVRLAVALLKDRNGVIDVNLPIGGSLDDPEFSVGRIVLQIILNIIVKAVTSPFALIGSLFGGGAELSYAAFEPGGETPAPEGLKGIAGLRAALVERPGLSLEVTGRADPLADRESLRRRRFEQQLKAQKLKDMARKGAAAASLDAVVVEPAEYEKYLRRAYKDAKFPRPRNFLGVLKELPLAETENLLLTNTPATDDDLVNLANRRAQAAKDLLVAGEGVAPGRVFLLAPVVGAADPQEKRPPARVDFTLK